MSASQEPQKDEDYRTSITLEEIPKDARTLLTSYAGIPEHDLIQHILTIRDKAYALSPYPCIGQIRFLTNRWPTMPYFPTHWLPLLHSGATLLDIGCGFGQELRFLSVNYSIPTSQLYALDIEPGLIDLGYTLFRDRDRFKATFFAADLLHPDHNPSSMWKSSQGEMDLIQASQIFHVWDYEEMFVAAKKVVSLTRGAGSMIGGNQVGSRNEGSYEIDKGRGESVRHYRHSEGSWRAFWERVGAETGTRWEIFYQELEADKAIRESKGREWARVDPGLCMFNWWVTRL